MIPGIDTGGGGLSSSSSADGDNTFNNGDFNYNSSSKLDSAELLVIGGLILFAVLYMGRK